MDQYEVQLSRACLTVPNSWTLHFRSREEQQGTNVSVHVGQQSWHHSCSSSSSSSTFIFNATGLCSLIPPVCIFVYPSIVGLKGDNIHKAQTKTSSVAQELGAWSVLQCIRSMYMIASEKLFLMSLILALLCTTFVFSGMSSNTHTHSV